MDHTQRSARIVLVEDNPADILLFKKALQEKGIAFELTCFEDGEEALNRLSEKERNRPDIILLDMNLPMFDGGEVLARIRSIPTLNRIPVAILTSSESPADRDRTSMLGADRYINKPISLNDYLREVGREVEEMLLAGQESRSV